MAPPPLTLPDFPLAFGHWRPGQHFPEVSMSIRRSLFALALVGALPLAASAQALPDGKALLAKHEAAVGGREAMDKHSSLHITGTFSLAAMGIEGPIHIYRAKPSFFLQHITIGAFGEALQGYDGTTPWAVQPGQGAVILSGAMADDTKQQANFLADFPDLSRYSAIQTVALEDFEGRKCYKVKLTKVSGGDVIQYFDAETGLAAGSIRSNETPMGTVEVTIVLSDYKDQGGVKMPSKVVQKTPQGDVTLAFATYEWDKVDTAIFALPDAVKSLVKP